MKKLIFIFLSGIIINLQAQDLQFIFNNTVLNDGDTILVEGSDTVWEVVAYLSVKNNSSNNLITKAKRELLSTTVDNSSNAFCWGVCFPPSIDVGTMTVTLAANETNDEFSGHHYNNNYVSGITFVKYTIFDTHNESNDISVVVKYGIGDYTTVSPILNHKEEAFQVYPNPATDICYISMKNHNKASLVQVYDILGNLVLKNESTGVLNISDLKQGLYLIKINNENYCKRLIKQ